MAAALMRMTSTRSTSVSCLARFLRREALLVWLRRFLATVSRWVARAFCSVLNAAMASLSPPGPGGKAVLVEVVLATEDGAGSSLEPAAPAAAAVAVLPGSPEVAFGSTSMLASPLPDMMLPH